MAETLASQCRQRPSTSSTTSLPHAAGDGWGTTGVVRLVVAQSTLLGPERTTGPARAGWHPAVRVVVVSGCGDAWHGLLLIPLGCAPAPVGVGVGLGFGGWRSGCGWVVG